MRTTFNVNFYCRDSKKDKKGLATVEMGITLNGVRVFIHIPMKADPKEFNRKRRPTEIDEQLSRWRKKVDEVVNEMMDEGQALTAIGIREMLRTGGVKSYTIENLFNDYLKILRTRGMTGGSYRKYELVKEKFIEYIGNKERQLNTIKDTDISGFYEELKGEYQLNSSASYMAKLKSFFKYGMDIGKLRRSPFTQIKVKREKKQIEYLTDAELKVIKTTELSTTALDRVRDIFLLQCYSGLSFIDMENLKAEDIKKSGDTYYIYKERIKTKIRYTAVIIEDGIEILKKYNYKLPIISNQKTNSALKAIARECKIDKTVYTHLGRKTYGHILLKRGIRIEAVAKALGHSEIKTTQRYYAELNEESILKEFGKIIK
jgi:integrase